jgi:hypothetical protein
MTCGSLVAAGNLYLSTIDIVAHTADDAVVGSPKKGFDRDKLSRVVDVQPGVV